MIWKPYFWILKYILWTLKSPITLHLNGLSHVLTVEFPWILGRGGRKLNFLRIVFMALNMELSHFRWRIAGIVWSLFLWPMGLERKHIVRSLWDLFLISFSINTHLLNIICCQGKLIKHMLALLLWRPISDFEVKD